jgi:diguanylate cyclase (GGDEF)-like protein
MEVQSAMKMRWWTRTQRATVLLSLAYASFFIYMLIARPGSRHFYQAFFNIYQIAPPLFAGICGLICHWFGVHSNPIRRVGWLLIGLGCLSWAGGQATWTYLETIRGIEVPFPSWADAGYLGGYPLLIAGVLLLFGSMPIAGRARQLLDNAIAASSVGLLSWYFIVQRQWHQSDVSLVGKCISVAYPLGDIAALFGAVVLLSSAVSNRVLRRPLYFLATGIVLFTFFDTSFTLMSLNGTYETGSWSDWTVSFGWLLIGYSFLTKIWWLPKEQQLSDQAETSLYLQQRSVWQIVMPYLAVTIAFSIVGVHDYVKDRAISYQSITAAMFLVALVLIRQVLTLVENRALTAKLKAFSDNLERTVAQRTEQLTALYNLTKAVSTTMLPDDVLAAALTHTKEALRADAIILWLVEEPGFGGDGARKGRVKLHDGFEDKPEMLEFLSDQPVREVVDAVSLITAPHSDRSSRGSCLRAPLRWQQSVTGMMGVVRWNAEFGVTECQLLESIGLEVGTTLENARLYSAAVEAADIDSVTGLLNHRAIHQRLDRALHQAKRLEQPLSVIMMDMDNFKLFNDTYGHPVGDQVLKRVGKTLGTVCQQGAILGRYGGDEFIVVLPHTDSDEALAIAQTLRGKLDLTGFQRPKEDRVVPVTVSFGIASFPADSTNRHELLTIADSNLYAAKDSDERIAATTEMQRANRRLRGEGSFAVLDALVTAVDNKDRYTRRHSEDVTEYALWIAEEMSMSEETQRQIRIAGLLHDVGKIGVPDEILRKPGRLTPEEYEVVQRHAWIGALIVSAVPGMEGVVDAVRCHHERWSGQGYPGQLAGEEIPLIGRIMAIADAFSAMTTDRTYRRALSWEAALQEMCANKGTQFDPIITDAFLRAATVRRRAKPPEREDPAQALAA